MTLRQVSMSLEAINIEHHNNYAGQAALNGKKIQFKEFTEEFEEIDDDQKEIMAKMIREATQRNVLERSKKNQKV